jgi:hypothetical protein
MFERKWPDLKKEELLEAVSNLDLKVTPISTVDWIKMKLSEMLSDGKISKEKADEAISHLYPKSKKKRKKI